MNNNTAVKSAPKTMEPQNSTPSNPNQQVAPVKATSNLQPATPLTSDEVKLLALHEETISKGLKEFNEVYVALQEICELRLYRQEFDSFMAYCREKWDISARYAYHKIKAGEVIEHLKSEQLLTNEPLAIPENESQARSIAHLPKEKQLEAARIVAQKQGKPTAKHFKDAADKVAAKDTEPEPDPEDEEEKPRVKSGFGDDTVKPPVKNSGKTKTIDDLGKLLGLVDQAQTIARTTTGCEEVAKMLGDAAKLIMRKLSGGAR